MTTPGERFLLGRFKVESAPGVYNPDADKMWKPKGFVIDIEKFKAEHGIDGHVMIDENTLILPPKSEGK